VPSIAFDIRILHRGDEPVLTRVAPGVFDHPLDPDLTAEFLADPRHHLAVALDGGVVVAMASAVHYVHPDKRPELWINEVGVAPSHQHRGIATALLGALLQTARTRGCVQAWVLTHRSNPAAMKLYASSGGIEASEDSVMFEFRL
jgi:GNAT superfamily N-acetyltransferase